MHLNTPVQIPSITPQISSSDRVFSLGSCFAMNLANLLRENQWLINSAQYGTIFNPLSIANVLHRTIHTELVIEKEIHHRQDIHFHYDFHSDFNGLTANDITSNINKVLRKGHGELKKSNWLILTFGSSIVHERISTGEIVGNCHKMPRSQFEKRILTISEMQEALMSVISDLTDFNPDIQIIITVSPVRHTREGLSENNRSKARLIELAHRLCDIPNIHYFPAYEIMMDELRDYRYYNEDLIHPNEVAVNYIWKQFQQAAMHKSATQKLRIIEKINNDLAHRPLLEHSQAHHKFLIGLIKKIKSASKKYPEINYNRDIKRIERSIQVQKKSKK